MAALLQTHKSADEDVDLVPGFHAVGPRAELTDWLVRLVENLPNVRATSGSIKRYVDVFVRTCLPSPQSVNKFVKELFYSPLVGLGLVRKLERDTLMKEALEVINRLGQQARPVIFASLHTLTGLEDTVADVESWRWVEENMPALNGDRVAKRELAARLAHAQRRLKDIAGRVFQLQGYCFEPGAVA